MSSLLAGDCPDTVQGFHGPVDGRGYCPWCGRKVTAARMPPRTDDTSALADAYSYAYDPDWGGRERGDEAAYQ